MPKELGSDRGELLAILEQMPDEAFGWIVAAIAVRIYPDGLGGFRPESRASIERARAQAKRMLVREPNSAHESGGGTPRTHGS